MLDAIISLSIGTIFCLFGTMMLVWPQNFLIKITIKRFVWFQKAIRRKEIEVKKKELTIFFTILYFVIAIPLLTMAIIGFINTQIPSLTFIWVYVAIVVLGIIGVLYINISKHFIQSLEQTAETA
ncbi:MAG: hypothetical protein HZR80_10150 [Candidatus Heimdallarchaeota archaeon]